MNKKIQDAMERAAEEFNNDVWGGEEDRCYIMSFKRGFKKAHSPEIIAMLEPEQLLANEAVRELVEALDFYAQPDSWEGSEMVEELPTDQNIEAVSKNTPWHTEVMACGGIAREARAKFQRGGKE